jgi:hypothetical protein
VFEAGDELTLSERHDDNGATFIRVRVTLYKFTSGNVLEK